MKVTDIHIRKTASPITVMDCFVDKGLVSGGHASLPDIDVDYASDRRQEIKEYLEERYDTDGRRRVFSAGTFTTMQLKAALKDVARVYRVPHGTVNYITAMLDDGMDWTGLFRTAAANKKLRDFIQTYPEVIEDVRLVLGQPKAASVHASAIIVTPEMRDGRMAECFDFLPIREADGVLVSEFDGYSVDEIGLLKEDVLATKELAKLNAVFGIVRNHYRQDISMEDIINNRLDDSKTYRLFAEGHTQDIFQFSGKGMTRFLTDLKPRNINDLIAANALYRPATIESGSVDRFLDYRLGNVAPVYLWGTYNALKDTYGLLVYQEELAQMAREVGGFPLEDGVRLVKMISKKKTDLIHAMRGNFMAGAAAKGCPKEDAVKVWDMIESGGSYLFNKCISGKERIYRPDSGRWQPNIAEMYRILNEEGYADRTGHRSLRRKYKTKGYGTAFSLNDEKRIVKNEIKDIRYMGRHPLYRITLENGATLDATANHKHPTRRGIIRTDRLIPGSDYMYVNAGYEKRDTSYRFTDKGSVNDDRYHDNYDVVGYVMNSAKGHCGFTRRPESEYVRREYYRKHLMKDYCEKCGVRGKRLEIHHRNGIHAFCGENFGNLITLCASCHKKEHYAMGRTKTGEKGLLSRLEKVVSVDYVRDDDVYDVEMCGPNHSFVTGNGIVTCNSHAAAYALTAYCGAWLKANYPPAFYTVALQWADDKEIPSLMAEMERCSPAKIVPPDINRSGVEFFTDYATDEIFWSLTRIRQVGVKTVEYIVSERARGQFGSIENFIHRIFRYKLRKYKYWDDSDNPDEAVKVPVNARHVRNMILAGCFDRIEKVQAVTERYAVLERAAKELGFSLSDKDFPAEMRDRHYFWSQQQIAVSGIGSIDYRRIFDNSEARAAVKGKAPYLSLEDVARDENDGRRAAVCATVVEVAEHSYKDRETGERKRFAKLTLSQNNRLTECVCWNDYYTAHRTEILSLKDKVVILTAMVRYSDYNGCNALQTTKNSLLFIQ